MHKLLKIHSVERHHTACTLRASPHGANYLNIYNLLLTIDCTVNKKENDICTPASVQAKLDVNMAANNHLKDVSRGCH